MAIISSLFGGSPSFSGQPTQSTTTYAVKELPPEIRPAVKDILEKGKAQWEGQEYTPYTGTRVAGFDPLQEQAFTGLAGLANRGVSSRDDLTNVGQYYDKAISGLDAASAQMTSDDISRLMNPYTQAVTDQVKRQSELQQEKARQSLDAQAAGYNAFGGSRAGLTSAYGEDLYQRRLGDIQERGDKAAYGEAARLFANEKERQFKAAAGQQGLASAIPQQAQQEYGMLGSVGGERQGQAQTAIDQAYGDFLEEREFDTRKLQEYSSLVHGQGFQPSTYTTKSDYTPTPSIFEQLLSGVGTAAALYGAYGGGKAGGGQIRKYASGGEIKHYLHGGGVSGTLKHARDTQIAAAKALGDYSSTTMSPQAAAARRASSAAAIQDSLVKERAFQQQQQRQNMFRHMAQAFGGMNKNYKGRGNTLGNLAASATTPESMSNLSNYQKAQAAMRAAEKKSGTDLAGLDATEIQEILAGHQTQSDLAGANLTHSLKMTEEERAKKESEAGINVAQQSANTATQAMQNTKTIADAKLSWAKSEKKVDHDYLVEITKIKDGNLSTAAKKVALAKVEEQKTTQKNEMKQIFQKHMNLLEVTEIKNINSVAIADITAAASGKLKPKDFKSSPYIEKVRKTLQAAFGFTISDNGFLVAPAKALEEGNQAFISSTIAGYISKIHPLAEALRKADPNLTKEDAMSKAVGRIHATLAKNIKAGFLKLPSASTEE
jgi:hypothetical protein